MLTLGLAVTALVASAPIPGRLLDIALRSPTEGDELRRIDLTLPSARSANWIALLAPSAGTRDTTPRPEDEPAPDAPASKGDEGVRAESRAGAPQVEGERGAAVPGTPPEQQATPSLDFNLLGEAPKSAQVDEGALRRRRTFLQWHQAAGLGMLTLELATTVVGQLNYDDKFGGDNTNKYAQTHAVLAYATLASFAAAGTLALLAPAPIKRSEGFDRVSLHKLGMYTAAAGMLAQGVLGVWTQSREGYLNQQGIATAHLVVGYVTLAAVLTGVGALVF